MCLFTDDFRCLFSESAECPCSAAHIGKILFSLFCHWLGSNFFYLITKSHSIFHVESLDLERRSQDTCMWKSQHQRHFKILWFGDVFCVFLWLSFIFHTKKYTIIPVMFLTLFFQLFRKIYLHLTNARNSLQMDISYKLLGFTFSVFFMDRYKISIRIAFQMIVIILGQYLTCLKTQSYLFFRVFVRVSYT